MDTKNISFFELDDKSYLITNQSFLGCKRYNYEDSYNYYDITVNNILLYKKSDNEYVRYNDKYKSAFVSLQLRIKNFSSKMEIYTSNDKVMFIYSDDEELFKKCRKIWNKITKLITLQVLLKLIQMVKNLLWQMYMKIQALLKAIMKMNL